MVELAKVMKNSSCLIISSQSPLGVCCYLRDKLKNINPKVELAYSPENLQLGKAIQCYLHPGRIILGVANEETKILCTLLFNNISENIISMSLESAELVKHGIN